MCSDKFSLKHTQHATVVPDLVNYKAEASQFQSFMFQQNVLENVKPLDLWKSQTDHLNQETLSVVYQLLSATASSAGVERVFSSFGLVGPTFKTLQSTWNWKSWKASFFLNLMNKKPLAGEDELKIVLWLKYFTTDWQLVTSTSRDLITGSSVLVYKVWFSSLTYNAIWFHS